MKLTFEGTSAEQTQFKQNLKTNQADTEITYTIHDKPEDMTCGEYLISMIDWRITD